MSAGPIMHEAMRRPLVVSLLVLLIVEIAIGWGYRSSREKAEEFLTANYADEAALFQKTVIQHYSDLETILMREFVQKNEIQSLMYEAWHAKDETLRTEKRNELYVRTRKLYEWLDNEYGIRQFHFHFPDTTSFLRLHEPQKFGDVLAKTRYSVVLANREKRRVQGFEEGKIFNGFRFVTPLSYHGEHVGSVELSFGFDTLHDWMEKVDDAHVYMILKRSIVNEHVFADKQSTYAISRLSPDYMHEKKLVAEQIPHHYQRQGGRAHILDLDTFHRLNALLAPQIAEDLKSGKNFVRWVEYEGMYYAVVFTPLMNVKNEHTGYLISYFPDDMMLKYVQTAHKILSLALAVPVLIWLAFMYIYYLREKERVQLRYSDRLIRKIEALNASLQERVEEGVQELRQRDHLMLQQSKLAAMGEMIGNIAHQWRQPLNALALKIQDIEDAHAYGELNGNYIRNVTAESMAQIQFMSKTIDDFRQFFLPDKQKEYFNQRTAVEESLQMVRFGLERHGIAVDWDVKGSEDGKIYGYKNEYKQVLINLLKNAEDALTERMSRSPSPTFKPAIFIRTETAGGRSRLIIEDNAGGIPEEILERIFEPYFTTKEEGKGTGIGLYMSKMIIEKNMHGSLSVINSEKGALFTIEFTRDSDTAAH